MTAPCTSTEQSRVIIDNGSTDCISVLDLMLHRHDWTTFTVVRVGFISFYATLCLFGLMGNVAMIYTITRLRRHISVANIFLINLGICDILLCITAVPITPSLYLNYTWNLGVHLCKFVPFCQAVCVIVSNLSLSEIALDRYNNIVHPQRCQFRRRHAAILTAVNWTVAVNLSLQILFNNNLAVHNSICGTFCKETWDANNFLHTNRQFISLVLVGVTYCGPLMLQTFCSIPLLVTVRRDTVIGNPEMSERKAEQIRMATKRKRRVMYTLISMMATFGFCWLPLTLLNIGKDFALLRYLHPLLHKQILSVQFGSHAIAMTCVVWNPVLYFWMSQSHRDELRRELLTAAVLIGVDRHVGQHLCVSSKSPKHALSSTFSHRRRSTRRESGIGMSVVR